MIQPTLDTVSWVVELESLLKKAQDCFFNSDQTLHIKSSECSLELKHQMYAAGVFSNKSFVSNNKVVLIVTDAVYDRMERLYTSVSNKALPVGAPVRGKKGVKLPFSMYSLTQVEGEQLVNWLAANPGPYVVSAKIDGVAVGYEKKADSRKAYTRGDGTTGGDISQVLPYFKIPDTGDIQVRGEAVIPIKKFESNWVNTFSNPRAMMSGLLNPDRKTIHPGICDAVFYAHELIHPRVKPSDALKFLESKGFNVVPHRVFNTLTIELLEQLLVRVRKAVGFEMDGLVITCNTKPKPGALQNSIKFKNNLNDDTVNAVVKSVQWRLTRTSILFPRVVIEPVNLGGVVVQYCSGKSAKRIHTLGVGKGAVISIARSGGVIPDIRNMVKPVDPDMPTNCDWEWVGDNIKVKSESVVLQLEHLVNILGINGLKSGGLKRFTDGGISSTKEFMRLTQREFLKYGGVLVAKAWQQLEDAKTSTDLATWMYASGVFDRNLGMVRFSTIIENIPNILTIDQTNLVSRITRIEGFKHTLASTFVKSLPEFISWLEAIPSIVPVKNEIEITGSKCRGHLVVFTGVRDANLLARIIAEGGEQVSSAKKATHVLVKDPTFTSTTTRDALARGIKPMLLTDYVNSYL